MAPRKSRGASTRKGKGSQSSSSRAGLIFPVGRCNRYLRQGRYAQRLGGNAGVYMAAVL